MVHESGEWTQLILFHQKEADHADQRYIPLLNICNFEVSAVHANIILTSRRTVHDVVGSKPAAGYPQQQT